jgi:hypothetical protein
MKPYIFLSYSRRDQEFVTQLYQYLTEKGLSVWFDQAKGLGFQEGWRAELAKGIQECTVHLLVLSPAAVASSSVPQEVNLADRHDKQIVPLLWQNPEVPAALEEQLASFRQIDIGGEVTAERLNDLVEELQRLVGHDLASE